MIVNAFLGRVARVNHRPREDVENAFFGWKAVRLRLTVDLVCGLVGVEDHHNFGRLCRTARRADEQARCSVDDTH